MTTHRFDGGPAHPCTDANTERCGISVRALIFAHVVAQGAFEHAKNGDFIDARVITERALEVTDAGLDALEIKP
jgi:hypothetical protein